MTPEMMMEIARHRYLNDADFRLRAERTKQFVDALVKSQHIENRPDVIIDVTIGIGMLMAVANIEEVMHG